MKTDMQKHIEEMATLDDPIVVEIETKRLLVAEHKHTNECLQYAALTGKAYCIAECRDKRVHCAATNAALLEALQAFVDAKDMTGWNEGNCDLWLGPIWHKATEAIRKASQ